MGIIAKLRSWWNPPQKPLQMHFGGWKALLESHLNRLGRIKLMVYAVELMDFPKCQKFLSARNLVFADGLRSTIGASAVTYEWQVTTTEWAMFFHELDQDAEQVASLIKERRKSAVLLLVNMLEKSLPEFSQRKVFVACRSGYFRETIGATQQPCVLRVFVDVYWAVVPTPETSPIPERYGGFANSPSPAQSPARVE